MFDPGCAGGGRFSRHSPKLLALVLSASFLVALGCKKSQADLDAEEAQKVIESKAGMRERLRKAKIARAEKEEYLKAHPELLEPPAEPDPAHRPTAPADPNLPPQLFGAPAVDPATIASTFPLPLESAAPATSAPPRTNRKKKD